MTVRITFRHLDPSDAIKDYAREKIGKLQKFLRQPMSAKVTLSVDKLAHLAEVQISSGGEHQEAHVVSDDMYASIDAVADKLERQIRTRKGAAEAKKRRATLRSSPVASPEPLASAREVGKGASSAGSSRPASKKKTTIQASARPRARA
ncbi:MAG: ribosome-associated translation inhibitor RaiA [Polyangiaceae bacterium]|nr:ribosome-associated translation inhibitor RaiA [Polyangiaceae bacterium]